MVQLPYLATCLSCTLNCSLYSETNSGELSDGKATVYAGILTVREAAIDDEALLDSCGRILMEKQ